MNHLKKQNKFLGLKQTCLVLLLLSLSFSLVTPLSTKLLAQDDNNRRPVPSFQLRLADQNQASGQNNSAANSNQYVDIKKADYPPYITAKPGDMVPLVLPLLNCGNINASNVKVRLSPKNQPYKIPFENPLNSYQKNLPGTFLVNTCRMVEFGSFKVRDNISEGDYQILFRVNYKPENSSSVESAEVPLLVKVSSGANTPQPEPQPEPEPSSPIPSMTVPLNPDLPGGSDGGAHPEGGGSIGGGSIGGGDIGGPALGAEKPDDHKSATPRILVSGFSLSPEKVFGGKEFDLSIKIKNTSKSSPVKNIKMTLTSQAEDQTVFLPVDGASTIYIDSIDKEAEKSVSIKLKSNPAIPQKIYPLNLKFDYEDNNGAGFQADEMISIMVNQEMQCNIGKMQIMPSPVNVGGEANIMFSVFNKGKATLNNLSIVIPEGKLEANEIFVGNIEPGASKDVDFMVKALSATSEPIPFQIVFEDAEGNESKQDQKMNLEISEPTPDPGMDPDGNMDGLDGMGMDGDMGEAGPTGFPWWGYLLIVIGGFSVLGVTLKVIRNRKAKKEQAEIDEMA